MSDNDVKAEQESVQKELNHLTLESDDESGNSSTGVFPNDIMIIPGQFLASFDHHYMYGDRMTFGASKLAGVIKRINAVLDDFDGSDDKVVVYYVHKALKHYCLPHDVFDIAHCNVLYDVHFHLQSLWKTDKKPKKGKKTKAGLTKWQKENELIVSLIKQFYDTLFEFDREHVIREPVATEATSLTV